MTDSLTWPPSLLRRLTDLADLQEYECLWILILRSCFRTPFFRIRAAKNEHTSEQHNHCYIVSHDSRRSPCFFLTWHPGAKVCCGDPYRRFVSDVSLGDGRVHRLHAIGTRISCYEIEPYGRFHDGQLVYRPVPSPQIVESFYDLVDAEVLEPIGCQRLMIRIKMAWAEAGVTWRAPNFDIMASEACHGGAGLTKGQTSGTGTCSQSPLASITGFFCPLPSNATAVPHLCVQQDPSAHSATTPLHHASSFHKFPQEIMMEVLGHVSLSDLRSFALASTLCNDLAGRRLWRKFVITGDAIEEVSERCTALLRLPDRANRVNSLVIGPGRWT